METVHLIERCRSGDGLAIGALVQTYQPPVFRLALSILDDPQEAEEAAQDTFVAAIRALDTYRGDSSFTTWLYSITINTCRMHLRKGRSRRRLFQALQSLFEWNRTTTFRIEERVVQNETNSTIWKAVQELDEKHRVPIILHYYHDLPTNEIAEILEISPGTVHSRLHTARVRIQAALQASPEPEWREEFEQKGNPPTR
ncbi:MAG TPA: RNA polymerase sigma factor [Anaerolineaceae bacterium]|nr:RNA polymerase sigma factor [Anaerolineaceae bacterium]